MNFEPLSPLPLLTGDLPGIAGRIKTHPEDFEVEEIPAYQPCGTGEHLFLWVEKRSLGAEYFLRQLARRLNIPTGLIGTAGLKDRHAVTRQYVSVPVSAESDLSRLDGEGIRVLSVSRHTNKLKSGHLRGNRFRILLRDVEPSAADRLPPLLERIRSHGLINFYGSQRFGREGETLHIGQNLLAGKAGGRLSPFLRRLALSAVQSALFNHVVAVRFRDGLLRRILTGDVMGKWPTGGLFVATDVAREQQRFEARETVITGPMFGARMFPAAAEAAAREQAALQDAGLQLSSFAGFCKLLPGTRRYALVYVDDLRAQIEPEGVRLEFSLPAGSYATILIRELTHSESHESEQDE